MSRIYVNHKAVASLTSFHASSARQFNGTAQMVSAHLLSENLSGQSYYSVMIGFSNEELEKLGTIKIIPGMPADSFIQTEKRSVMRYLLRPVTRALGDHFAKSRSK